MSRPSGVPERFLTILEERYGRRVPVLARDYLNDLARRHPDTATELGDHRFDGQLPDLSADALADERRALGGFEARLAAIGPSTLTTEERADAAMLADGIARRAFEIDELREHSWNPLAANPGRAVYLVLARDFAPLPDRLAAVAGRLDAIPGALAAARAQLGAMPRVHLETAITQFDGTIKLAGGVPGTPDIDRVRPAALAALVQHQGARCPRSSRCRQCRRTGARSGPRRSTASTTGTWCTT